MARREYWAIPRCKRVAAAHRETDQALALVDGGIQTALSGRRTDDEMALLNSIRDQVGRVRQDASRVLPRLYAQVED